MSVTFIFSLTVGFNVIYLQCCIFSESVKLIMYVSACYTLFHLKENILAILINRPGVAGAVLHTASSLNN